jgi:hypothetical protein
MGVGVPGLSADNLPETPVQDALRASIARNVGFTAVGASFSDDDFDRADQPAASTEKKSRYRAALYSLLIPGAGQYYLGKKRTARYYFAAEAITWIGYLSFRTYGNWKKDDYIKFGAVHANAQLEGKSDEFLAWVGFYENIREFNTFGRVGDPDRPYLADTPENHWEWQTPAYREAWRDIRNRSKEAYRRADFMIGVAIVNRVISVIDAIRSAGRMDRRIDDAGFSLNQQGTVRLALDPLADGPQISLKLYPGI